MGRKQQDQKTDRKVKCKKQWNYQRKKRRKAIESLMTGDNSPVLDMTRIDAHAMPKRSKSEINIVSGSEGIEKNGDEKRSAHERMSPVSVVSQNPDKSPLLTKSASNPADDLSALLSMQSAKEREERSQQE